MSQVLIYKTCLFISLKINYVLKFANSGDPDEMQHTAAFHLRLHCLQKYLLTGFSLQRVSGCQYRRLKSFDII